MGRDVLHQRTVLRRQHIQILVEAFMGITDAESETFEDILQEESHTA